MTLDLPGRPEAHQFHLADPARRGFFSRSASMLVGGTSIGQAVLVAMPAMANEEGREANDHIVAKFYPGFRQMRINTSGAEINTVTGGKGPALLLLHGYPQTLVEWRNMAPQLAKKFTVVMTDLRGYGDSSKPPGGDDHYGYSKRAMSDDQIEVMTALGHERFAVIGHDRGGRVAHRMALDHANRVDRLAVIDIVPTRKVYESVDRVVATQYFHWFFLIQNAPFPETLINNNPETWLENFGQTPAIVGQDCYAEYLRCFKNPATVHAICEDYRAGASIDLEHDASDLDKKISCPLFVLWGAKGLLPHYDVLATWSERAAQVSGKELPGGHWLPERLPAETLAALETFLDA